MHQNVGELVENFSGIVGRELKKLVPPNDGTTSSVLVDSMDYCLSNPGKCLRAFLVNYTAQIFGIALDRALRLGIVVEVIHTYSLIHDDLPSMDNAAFRRGKDACHRKYGEAIAVLTGDALLTLAFELLVTIEEDNAVRCELVELISKACGYRGMISGQALDVGNDHVYSLESVSNVHALKTACMFSAACEAGAILGSAPANARRKLALYGLSLGCAFQAQDDLSDVDEDKQCMNIAKILGVEETNNYIDSLLHKCEEHLTGIDADVSVLKGLITFVRNLKI